MDKILEMLTKNVIDFIYEAVDEDVTYAEEADRILGIMDAIRDIENVTELVEVCDGMRSDFIDLMRGDNVEAAFALQSILHTLKDLATCHEIINCFTRATINWRRGISTRDEALADYEQIVRDRLNITLTFTDVHEYTWAEVWDLCHEG